MIGMQIVAKNKRSKISNLEILFGGSKFTSSVRVDFLQQKNSKLFLQFKSF